MFDDKIEKLMAVLILRWMHFANVVIEEAGDLSFRLRPGFGHSNIVPFVLKPLAMFFVFQNSVKIRMPGHIGQTVGMRIAVGSRFELSQY